MGCGWIWRRQKVLYGILDKLTESGMHGRENQYRNQESGLCLPGTCHENEGHIMIPVTSFYWHINDRVMLIKYVHIATTYRLVRLFSSGWLCLVLWVGWAWFQNVVLICIWFIYICSGNQAYGAVAPGAHSPHSAGHWKARAKPNCASTFEASSCFAFINIPLAKADCMVNIGGPGKYTLSTGTEGTEWIIQSFIWIL